MKKVVWITGGGTGIGFALAKAHAAEGWMVLITGRRSHVLAQAVSVLQKDYPSAGILSLAGDASDPTHIQEVIHLVGKQWGSVDRLVNNAGSNNFKTCDETTLEDYRKSFDMNCLSSVLATTAVLPSMLKKGAGEIVNISSILGLWASSSSASYSVSKYAMTGYTDVLRERLLGTPVHVLGVYPGFIQTDMTMPFVRPGSFKSKLGKSPADMARAILRALDRRRTELLYPWYVPWALRLHRWFPGGMAWAAQRFRR